MVGYGRYLQFRYLKWPLIQGFRSLANVLVITFACLGYFTAFLGIVMTACYVVYDAWQWALVGWYLQGKVNDCRKERFGAKWISWISMFPRKYGAKKLYTYIT